MHHRTSVHSPQAEHRRGAVIILTAVLLILLFGLVAFSVDYGYMAIVRGQLQNAADAAALAATSELSELKADINKVAKDVAGANWAAGSKVQVADADITPGVFDLATLTFTPSNTTANAVRVRTVTKNEPLFFARALGFKTFDMDAQATAMLNPRDIVLVVDLSGSMNDDVEPCWATQAIADRRAAAGQSTAVATDMAQTLYSDLSFGSYPGTEEWVGRPLGVPQDQYAYVEMTDDYGPLTSTTLDAKYRIVPTDSEQVRKYKAYAWIIDHQLARLMPAARPVPTSSSATSAAFWEKYLDYVIRDIRVGTAPPPPPPSGGGSGGGGGSPPPPSVPQPPSGNILPTLANAVVGQTYDPGLPRMGSTAQSPWVPIWRDGDRIWGFNNPNNTTYSGAAGPGAHENKLGYRTYVQFMLDFGRDRSPDVDNATNASDSLGTKTQLSTLSPFCAYHKETIGSTTFGMPPRTQPMHACRRSLIRAIQLIEFRNKGIASLGADRVSVVSFDGQGAYHAPQVVVPFTTDYVKAMQACTKLQAVSDIGNTTGTEAGLRIGREMLRDTAEGGFARPFAKKVMVLLTDGVPNAWESSQTTVDGYISANPNGDFYGSAYVWYNAPLMQAARAKAAGIETYAVGMGIGSDYDFLDRMARFADTDKSGQAPRTSGDPTAYEAELTKILEEIIRSAGTRLVE